MNKFPYTDFHEMNMDWISSKVLALKESIKNINVSIQSVIEQLTGKADKDELATVAFTGDYDDLSNKPVIPDVSDYYDKDEVDQLLDDKVDNTELDNYYTKTETEDLLDDKADTADLATVAFSGDYDDLIDKPVIPDVSNYYTKTETDTLLNNKEDSLGSGNIGEVLTQVGANLKSWVEPHYVRPGGTTGQVLTKASNADYAIAWEDPFIIAQQQSNWAENDTTSVTYIQNKPTLATVATSGSYSDLINKPTLTFDKILDVKSIPQAETSYSCEWSSYDALSVDLMQYGNILDNTIIPLSDFAVTSSGRRPILYKPDQTTISFNVYKNTDNTVYLRGSSAPDSVYGIRIWGIKLA